MSTSAPPTVWTFGYGSNMNVAYFEQKKGHKVFDHVVGVVHGYKLAFDIPSFEKFEPAFANAVKGDEEDTIHGVAIQVSEDDWTKLNQLEVGYEAIKVTVKGYNGRIVEGCFIFSNSRRIPLPVEEQTPTARYMRLVIKGAIDANLDEDYINRLKARKTYVPDNETLTKRDTLTLPTSLPSYTVDELFTTKTITLESGEDAYVAILGYVFKMPRSRIYFNSHLGRDVTSATLGFYRGESWNKIDDMGRPPYPKLSTLDKEEIEYLFTRLDHYLCKGEVVGYIKEFLAENDVTKIRM